jgi:hypothetical protein
VDSSTTLGSDSSSKTRAVCLNHQNHLAFMNITCGILGLATFNELYLDAMFWRGGNYFRRLFAGWVAFYKSDLEESSGAETTWSRSYKVALLSYFTSTLPFRQANRKSIEASEAHESVVQLKAFLDFFDFDPAGGAKCATSWANNEERSQAVKLAAHLTQQALNRTIPSLPEIGKWTKLGPTLDQHVIGFVGDLFSRCARFTLTSAYGAKLSESMQGYEQEFLKSVAFQKVGGTRFKRIMNNRGSDDFKFRVVLLALVLEPFRHLTSYLMRASHRSWSNSAEIGSIKNPNFLLDLLNHQHSLLISALQYYSGVLSDVANWKRLPLLLASRGCATYDEWVSRFPGDLDLLACLILGCCGALERRLWRRIWNTFGLLSAGDARLPERATEAVIIERLKQNNCCCAVGLERMLVTKCRTLFPGDLSAQVKYIFEMLWTFVYLAWAILLSIALLECIHALHKRIQRHADGKAPHHLACASLIARHAAAFDATLKSEEDQRMMICTNIRTTNIVVITWSCIC